MMSTTVSFFNIKVKSSYFSSLFFFLFPDSLDKKEKKVKSSTDKMSPVSTLESLVKHVLQALLSLLT